MERPSRTFRGSTRFLSEAKRLGFRVRGFRERRALTLDRASSLAEIDLAHWQKIEAGAVNVTLATILRVADALGIGLDELFAPTTASRSAATVAAPALPNPTRGAAKSTPAKRPPRKR